MKMSDFKFGFSPEYVNALSKFMAKNDVRYYLNGINIKPHPKGGVILSATNGYALVTIHDELGFTDREYTIPMSAQFISAAKKKWSKTLPSMSVLFDGVQLFVTALSLDDEGGFSLNDKVVYYSGFCSEIDCKYPDLGRAFDSMELKEASLFCVNPEYIGLVKYCTDNPKFPSARFYLGGTEGSLVAISGMKQQFCTVIMPMRVDDAEAPIEVPSHVKALIKLSNIEKAKAEKAKKLEESQAKAA